jgi:hypothetical protein
VLCAPFGWDELCSHRSMRAWAGAIAQSGHAAIRFDLPGTGDSAGTSRESGLVARWCTAIADVASFMGETCGCSRVVAIGVGLGGMLATRALADGAAIDDLILWGVQARGSTFVRELRAFATMATGHATAAEGYEPPAVDDGSLEASGFILSADTLRDLDALDLTTFAIPDASGRRVLLLGRDRLPPDRRLHAHLEASGVELHIADGEGFGDMLTHPQFALRPHTTIDRTVRWLAEGDGSSRDARAPARLPAQSAAVTLGEGPDAIVERPFEFDYTDRRLTGVLSEPARTLSTQAPLTVVLLNAGAVRRIGPNRMWVEAARRWGAQGIPTLRFDAVGLGDSDGDEQAYAADDGEFYLPAGTEQVSAALDRLEAAGLPPRFVVGGLCSGAYGAFHAAKHDPRIQGLLLINLWTFLWSTELNAARARGVTRERLRTVSLGEIARTAVGRGRLSPAAGLRAGTRALRPTPRRLRHDPVATALTGLAERGTETLFLFSGREPLLEDLESGGWLGRIDGWAHVTLTRIPIGDHTFRPVWAQTYVHAQLDEAVRRAIDRVEGTGGIPPA